MNGGTQDGGSSRGKSLTILALSALAGFAAVYLTFGRGHNSASAPIAAGGETTKVAGAAETGSLAAFVRKNPPVELPDITFSDADGKPLTLSSFKGRTILLNLWATWCGPCREEMPSLDRLQAALGSDKFEVVALSLDRAGAEAAKKFLDEVKAKNLKLYIDPTAKQGLALQLIGMPTTILIDKNGREIGRLAGGAEWDSAEAKKVIEAAIN